MPHKRLLIEEWMPIAELSEESMRERRSMTSLPPTYYLHVWWARRPLVASRATILASILPADADKQKFLHCLGIHGYPVQAKKRIAQATIDGIRLGKSAYGYDRSFKYNLNKEDREWLNGHLVNPLTLLDPTAGGGSIPFEAIRLGLDGIANDLNPVSIMVLKATVEFPRLFGNDLLKRYNELSLKFCNIVKNRIQFLYPDEPISSYRNDGYLYARTVQCPYCSGIVPLSPNWNLSSKGYGVMLVPDLKKRRIYFQVTDKKKNISAGTVKGGTGVCPFPDCKRTIDGDEIKKQARAGEMGDQLYAIIYKEGKKRGYREPQESDENLDFVSQKLNEKLEEWKSKNIIPDEEYPTQSNEQRPPQYGMPYWKDFFNKRQLYGHCTNVEVFQEIVEEIKLANQGEVPDLDKAALVYISFALDKLLNYNSRMSVWMPTREVMANTFNRHDFAFCWSNAEMATTITGMGYDWAIEQTGKALKELIALMDNSTSKGLFQKSEAKAQNSIHVTNDSADQLHSVPDQSVDIIVMDPPYYDNVMYAELSDFFYVWLKRTAGLLYPEFFQLHLTDKDREAVANPARFSGEKGAKLRAGKDYQDRMMREI